jgi:hypothetical protein
MELLGADFTHIRVRRSPDNALDAQSQFFCLQDVMKGLEEKLREIQDKNAILRTRLVCFNLYVCLFFTLQHGTRDV